ncbi:MAG: KEOPS complex subunit Pcc1 [Methanobacterium sp.]
MKIDARIKFKYKTEEYADIVFKSLKPDNIGYIKSSVYDKYLICSINGSSIGTILSTADDLIFCEMMVEKTSELMDLDLIKL